MNTTVIGIAVSFIGCIFSLMLTTLGGWYFYILLPVGILQAVALGIYIEKAIQGD